MESDQLLNYIYNLWRFCSKNWKAGSLKDLLHFVFGSAWNDKLSQKGVLIGALRIFCVYMRKQIWVKRQSLSFCVFNEPVLFYWKINYSSFIPSFVFLLIALTSPGFNCFINRNSFSIVFAPQTSNCHMHNNHLDSEWDFLRHNNRLVGFLAWQKNIAQKLVYTLSASFRQQMNKQLIRTRRQSCKPVWSENAICVCRTENIHFRNVLFQESSEFFPFQQTNNWRYWHCKINSYTIVLLCRCIFSWRWTRTKLYFCSFVVNTNL